MEILTSLSWQQLLLVFLFLVAIMLVRNVTGMFFPRLAKWIPPGGMVA